MLEKRQIFEGKLVVSPCKREKGEEDYARGREKGRRVGLLLYEGVCVSTLRVTNRGVVRMQADERK